MRIGDPSDPLSPLAPNGDEQGEVTLPGNGADTTADARTAGLLGGAPGPDSTQGSHSRATWQSRGDNPVFSGKYGSTRLDMHDAPLGYDGHSDIASFLQTLISGESGLRQKVVPPTRLKDTYRSRADRDQALRVTVREMLAAQGGEGGVIAGHFTLEIEKGASWKPGYLVTIVGAGKPVATLSLDEDGRMSTFERGRDATPHQLAEAFECLSDVALFRATAKRLGVPSMTDEARAKVLASNIFAAHGLRWTAQLPNDNLIDVRQIIGPARPGGPPVSLQQIPQQLRREPLSGLFSDIHSTLPEEQREIVDALFEQARKLSPADRLLLLRTFSDKLSLLLDDGFRPYGSNWAYGVEMAMEELRRITPFVEKEEIELAAIAANIAKALPASANPRLGDELAQRAAQLSPEHRGRPMAALLGRASSGGAISVGSFDAFFEGVRDLPPAALNDALPTVAASLRSIDDAMAIPGYWDKLHELNATLREHAPTTWMAVTCELGQAIDRLPAGYRGAAFARLQDDIEAARETRDRWGSRDHVADGLSGMTAALPALEAESGVASADDAARWLLRQAEQLDASQSMTRDLRAALGLQREPFDILVRAASTMPNEEERAAAVTRLCQGALELAIRQPLIGFMRWYRLAQVIRDNLPPAHRDIPYDILSNIYVSSSLGPRLEEIILDGPQNVDQGKWVADLGESGNEVIVRPGS